MSDELRYLLDTNILSELIRQPNSQVVKQIERVGEHRICTSIVVAGELRFGAEKKASAKLSAQMEAVLSVMTVLPLEAPAERQYAKIRDFLEKQGTPIGPNDLWIAAQALAFDLIVVTANTKEFTRVPNLMVENWIK